MIHGKKRNKNLFNRLTENWGYVKKELTPLDEEMAAPFGEEEEEEEVQEEGVYKADEDREEVEEASNPRSGNEDRQRDGRNPPDRVHEAEFGDGVDGEEEEEEVVEEMAAVSAGSVAGGAVPAEEEEEEEALEETIRRVVTRVLNSIKAK